MTREEGNKNLLKLADYLDKVPQENFDYTRYANDECGTVACALGHACKLFPENLALVGGFNLDKEYITKHITVRSLDNGHYGCGAGRFLFGLDLCDADYLFLPGDGEEQATAKDVANKIREFVSMRS